MILSGEKKEEYREIKPFYDSRFSNILGYSTLKISEIIPEGKPSSKTFQVQFKNGYSKDCPSFICDCRLGIGTGVEEWGAEKNVIYYVLRIDKIYKKRMEIERTINDNF